MRLAAVDLQRRGLALAATAILPWLGLAGFGGSARLWLLGVCAAISLAALTMLFRLLRDPARAANLLGAARTPIAGATLEARTASLIATLDALEHRWVRRHAITGLPIRESFLEQVNLLLADAPDKLLVGAIRFRDYGRLAAFDPDAAEAALKLFAQRIAGSLDERRLLAHVDRDCFAIAFADIDPAAARQELAMLCYALGMEIEVEGLGFTPVLETGIAIPSTDTDTPTALLNQALLTFARVGETGGRAGRSRGGAEDARERFTIEQGLRQAVERRELELHFQPVIDLSRGLLVGAEALLRWRSPDIGMVSPARFIPVLERSDLASEIGLWVLNAACRETRRWRDEGIGDLYVAVNVSARQLRDAKLVASVERILRRHRLAPEALEIELTETAAAEDAEMARRLFAALRNLGVRIAIDDFGSGYSSLAYLKNLPFDKLKMDREFVRDVHLRRDSQAICRSLIELSRGLDIAILAEGVEAQEEVDTLERLGCPVFQGYYFSRPLGADAFIQYARHHSVRSGTADARAQQAKLAARIGR